MHVAAEAPTSATIGVGSRCGPRDHAALPALLQRSLHWPITSGIQRVRGVGDDGIECGTGLFVKLKKKKKKIFLREANELRWQRNSSLVAGHGIPPRPNAQGSALGVLLAESERTEEAGNRERTSTNSGESKNCEDRPSNRLRAILLVARIALISFRRTLSGGRRYESGSIHFLSLNLWPMMQAVGVNHSVQSRPNCHG